MKQHKISDWLPTTKREVEMRGWQEVDIIIFAGDAYVDHPSFGCAVIGRVLEAEGYKVAIVPQPGWKDDLRDFKKLGRPRLFCGVTAGCMDSMVNRYTANRRLRSDDAYTPDARPDKRPDNAGVTYCRCIRQALGDVPIVMGGIEASMRRLTHYDYWQDRLRESIAIESRADLLVYGMGEKAMVEIARRLDAGEDIRTLTDIPQTVYVRGKDDFAGTAVGDIVLHTHEECLRDRRAQADNFRHIEEESNKMEASRIIQAAGDAVVVVNPPYPPMTQAEIDHTFDLPYTRMPHPKYRGKRIPAYEMIRHSVNIHRGCFGGCAFCTISAHQGKFIVSRSKESILREVKAVTEMEDFKGYISDLGGPSANMYGMGGRDKQKCRRCKRPSCVHPAICPNLAVDHSALLDVYHAVEAVPGVKRFFVGSGVRYDLLLHDNKDARMDKAAADYTRELITRHVSGRLKVAPEHTSDRVLGIMRKPPFRQFLQFKKIFDRINAEHGLRQQLIPYFISSHPGCTEEDMAELAAITRSLNFHLEQVQDFTPTPMTVSTEIYYTGYHPYTLEKVYTARTREEKLAQRMFFFWYEREQRSRIIAELRKMRRGDLIDKLYGKGTK
ncbi:MAG TPA: YgiQ family radical SAM protein [Candidatus Avibacteroides avistercoris]|uniref:YgiQ family radical SAM protein n=1 Tax=Candidatus Avibacteroides avistercoris TaxID=2840690 RepID=A0A9D2ZTD3_9BACT|nr:YgiQ family radical SAM protein [Candidatus Avibacteroides avistercoris]